MKAKKLNKETVTLKDGRYLIYYSWAKGKGAEGGRQRTEGRGQKVEDRRRKTEDGRQRTEDRSQKSVKRHN